MIEVLGVVLPVFLVVGAGYLAVALGAFKAEYADGLMRFTQTFAIPCLLFLSIANLDLAAVFRPELLLPFYTGSAFSFSFCALGAYWLFKRRPGEAVAVGFCGLFANSVLLGLPIVERAFGADATQVTVAIVSIHAPFCYGLGIVAMEMARADGRGMAQTSATVVRQIFSNGLMIGIGLGFVANLTGIILPGGVLSAVELMARAGLPAALFGLGGVLVRYGIAGNLGEVGMINLSRLVLHPLIAFVLAHMVFALPREVVQPIVLTAAMSPGVNTYVFANMYDRAKGTAAAGVLVGTLAAVVSVTVWLVVLRGI